MLGPLAGLATSMGPRLLLGVVCAIGLAGNAAAQSDVCQRLSGASIIAQDDDNTFLGTISSKFNGKSIFNEFGTYGSEFSAESIWNKFSQFGSEFSAYSPFNKFSDKPPLIVKGGKMIAYLSANKTLQGVISAHLLKALCEDEL